MNGKDLFIIILAIVIGFLVYWLYCKRREDIIKLEIYREKLPAPGNGIPWVQGGKCFMDDGTVGIVEKNTCQRISVL